MDYADFIASKRVATPDDSIRYDVDGTKLYGFQRALLSFALRKGRSW